MGIKDLLQPTVWAVFEYIQVLSFLYPFSGLTAVKHQTTLEHL